MELLNYFKITPTAETILQQKCIRLTSQNLVTYLTKKLSQSIHVKFTKLESLYCEQFFRSLEVATRTGTLDKLIGGYGDSRGSKSWDDRKRAWHIPNRQDVLVLGTKAGMLTVMTYGELDYSRRDEYGFPVFLSLFDTEPRTSLEVEFAPQLLTQEIKEMSTTKTIAVPAAFSSVIEQNKDAVKLAAKLSVGKTANAFLLDAVTSKLPWYAKLFGKTDAVRSNPLTKVATAQLANLLAQHFAQGNEKVAYVADAMLQEAMVDLITNADVVNDLITKLGSFAGTLTDVPETK